MRTIAALFLAVLLTGCNNESFSSSMQVQNNPDGSSLKTEVEERTKNGVQTGTKTETRTDPQGKVTVTKFSKKDGQWVKE